MINRQFNISDLFRGQRLQQPAFMSRQQAENLFGAALNPKQTTQRLRKKVDCKVVESKQITGGLNE